MQVQMQLKVMAEEDGVCVEVGDRVEGLYAEAVLKIYCHFDGLLDVYCLVLDLLLVKGLDRCLLDREESTSNSSHFAINSSLVARKMPAVR